ncbi:hypothetical protein M422DRAFT_52033 [Sphaerobolus stellatus SS14]|uniref:Uncharacterized protein n=1 Tax=Sphaerobolus stellatus (strain SS14) TaxID=990650 RepID=A0A0C9VAE4_SPHS4|nr:hypothetical protein M422DRAFT_52033 [Sphaerobolus stellatus SS14]
MPQLGRSFGTILATQSLLKQLNILSRILNENLAHVRIFPKEAENTPLLDAIPRVLNDFTTCVELFHFQLNAFLEDEQVAHSDPSRTVEILEKDLKEMFFFSNNFPRYRATVTVVLVVLF